MIKKTWQNPTFQNVCCGAHTYFNVANSQNAIVNVRFVHTFSERLFVRKEKRYSTTTLAMTRFVCTLKWKYWVHFSFGQLFVAVFFSFSVDGISFVSLSIAINSMGAVYLHWNGFGRNCTQQRANVSLSTLKWSTWPMTKKSLDINTTTANGMNITNAQTHIQCSKFLATTNQNSIKARAICYQLQAERINFAISMWFWCERAYHWLTFVSANGQSIWFDVWWNTSRSDWKLPPITGWKKVRHFNFHILGAAFSLSALYTLHAVFLCEWM